MNKTSISRRDSACSRQIIQRMPQDKVKKQPQRGIGPLLQSWYRNYEFATAVSLLEPWEKRLVNGTVVTVFAAIVFSAGYYLPHYVNSVYDLFSS